MRETEAGGAIPLQEAEFMKRSGDAVEIRAFFVGKNECGQAAPARINSSHPSRLRFLGTEMASSHVSTGDKLSTKSGIWSRKPSAKYSPGQQNRVCGSFCAEPDGLEEWLNMREGKGRGNLCPIRLSSTPLETRSDMTESKTTSLAI